MKLKKLGESGGKRKRGKEDDKVARSSQGLEKKEEAVLFIRR